MSDNTHIVHPTLKEKPFCLLPNSMCTRKTRAVAYQNAFLIKHALSHKLIFPSSVFR